MKREIHFIPSAEVCSKEILIELEDDRIIRVCFTGGCHGNTQGIAALLCGMQREEAIRRLRGICCKQKTTSCPDQLAKALQEINPINGI
ncbi:TIGR03905 family TSCPD domain-containing protein [Sanguibacteroides sp. AM78-02pH3A]|uniref:TIGR03905 family TSCPD domain-containing protein n=1 Tax=Sanguibacteroides sp. AM78-02pH3A TaxID=3002646 RepID=UPI0022E4DE34|nr:TIGR03905 family TSCPD domain-containing protein [Sanguibacteroides sp. AM78-02pH3A]